MKRWFLLLLLTGCFGPEYSVDARCTPKVYYLRKEAIAYCDETATLELSAINGEPLAICRCPKKKSKK